MPGVHVPVIYSANYAAKDPMDTCLLGWYTLPLEWTIPECAVICDTFLLSEPNRKITVTIVEKSKEPCDIDMEGSK
jgi:hypothetical protein